MGKIQIQLKVVADDVLASWNTLCADRLGYHGVFPVIPNSFGVQLVFPSGLLLKIQVFDIQNALFLKLLAVCAYN
jgi:hypothetical protein